MMIVYASVCCICVGTYSDQKKASDHLELDL